MSDCVDIVNSESAESEEQAKYNAKANGPGLIHGVTGEPANFEIRFEENAGTSDWAIDVEGPSVKRISARDEKNGTVKASYLPEAPGEYTISVMFSEKHIEGSPFCARIIGDDLRLLRENQRHEDLEGRVEVLEENVSELHGIMANIREEQLQQFDEMKKVDSQRAILEEQLRILTKKMDEIKRKK